MGAGSARRSGERLGGIALAVRIGRAIGIDLMDALLGRSCPGCAGPTLRGRPVCDACDALVPRSGAARCLRCMQEGAAGPDGEDADGGGAARDAAGRGGCPRHGASRLLLAGPHYEPPLDRIVRAFKYASARELAPWIASLLPEPPARGGPLWREYVLVPVPLHPSRLVSRGFDQARLLAEAAGTAWGIPVIDALVRTRDHEPQARLPREGRAANVAGAFRPARAAAAAVRGRPLLLVDDVATTGSTLLEAAAALESGAPAWILALAAAHGGLGGRPEPSSLLEVAARRSV